MALPFPIPIPGPSLRRAREPRRRPPSQKRSRKMSFPQHATHHIGSRPIFLKQTPAVRRAMGESEREWRTVIYSRGADYILVVPRRRLQTSPRKGDGRESRTDGSPFNQFYGADDANYYRRVVVAPLIFKRNHFLSRFLYFLCLYRTNIRVDDVWGCCYCKKQYRRPASAPAVRFCC